MKHSLHHLIVFGSIKRFGVYHAIRKGVTSVCYSVHCYYTTGQFSSRSLFALERIEMIDTIQPRVSTFMLCFVTCF